MISDIYVDYNLLSENSVNYSVDMIRLSTVFTVEEFSKIVFKLKMLYKNTIKTYYNSFKLIAFRENYVIELSEGHSYWFGFMSNSQLLKNTSSSELVKYNFTIEFNPNKIPLDGFLKYVLSSSLNWVIKSFDIAMDMNVNILDFSGFDKKYKKLMTTYSRGYDDKTIYFGSSSSVSRFKLYNKAKELGIPGNLTRLEVSLKVEIPIINLYMFNFKVELPQLFLNDYCYSFKDYEDKTLLAVLYAVQCGFDIHNLSRVYKKKVEGLLKGGYQIPLSQHCCTRILQQCVKFMFGGIL